MLIAGLEKNIPRTTILKENKPKNDTLSKPILCASFKKVTFEMLDMLKAERMYHNILGEQHMPFKILGTVKLYFFLHKPDYCQDEKVGFRMEKERFNICISDGL